MAKEAVSAFVAWLADPLASHHSFIVVMGTLYVVNDPLSTMGTKSSPVTPDNFTKSLVLMYKEDIGGVCYGLFHLKFLAFDSTLNLTGLESISIPLLAVIYAL